MSAPTMPFVYHWHCLVSTPPKLVTSPSSSVRNCSFAQTLLNKVNVSLNQIPKPCLKGNSPSIKISKDVYHTGLSSCNNYLNGRLVLSRGDNTFSYKDLCEKLFQLWKPINQ